MQCQTQNSPKCLKTSSFIIFSQKTSSCLVCERLRTSCCQLSVTMLWQGKCPVGHVGQCNYIFLNENILHFLVIYFIIIYNHTKLKCQIPNFIVLVFRRFICWCHLNSVSIPEGDQLSDAILCVFTQLYVCCLACVRQCPITVAPLLVPGAMVCRQTKKSGPAEYQEIGHGSCFSEIDI